MTGALEVPRVDELEALGFEVASGDEPWVVTVTAMAGDGSVLMVAWDEVAYAATVRLMDEVERCVIERESVVKVAFDEDGDDIVCVVTCRGEGLVGSLFIRIGSHVLIRDSLLRE